MSDKIYVPGMGPIGAKFMILGEAPSYEETAALKPFVGPSGRELDKLLKDAGINRNDCWITNVCKYQVPEQPKGKKIPFQTRAASIGIDVDEQLRELQVEINSINPNVILALGGTALWAVTGKKKITDYRGSLLWGAGHKVVATYHPVNLIRQAKGGEIKGYWNRQVMILDIKRAWDERHTPTLNLPQRLLQICRNSGEFYEFLHRYNQCQFPSVDIEAGGHCLPVCVGIAFNRNHGMTIPLWNRDGWSEIADSDLVTIWRMLARFLASAEVIGQNFNYDRDKIRRLGFIIRRIISDTMLKSFAINPELPKRLAFNQSIYTREPFYKDEGMYEGSCEDLLYGCARDACVTKEIDEEMDKDLDELNLRKFYNNFLMKLPDFYLDIENTGFRIDSNRQDELLKKYIKWDEKLGLEIFQLAGIDVNVNSNGVDGQVGQLLFNYWKLPKRDGVSEEELTALLNLQKGVTDPLQRTCIEKILERRRVKRTISNALMALPDFDGRIRTTYFPCLETGRSSTGQQDPPTRPKIDLVGKGKKNDMKVMGTPFQVFTKHGDIGADVRSMYIPEEGEVFVNADSSQAEARVVFLLATDEQALKDIDEHDYHALTASWFFGGTEEKYSKKILGYESPIRFAGKTLRHAGHLGAGKRRAATELNTQARKYKIAITITEAETERALKIFHSKQPKIQLVFQNGVIECLKNTRKLIAPLPYGIDAEIGGVRTFFERWGEDLFRQAFSYIPQRSVSENTKAAGMRVKQRFSECRIHLEAHDSLLFGVRKEYLDEFLPIIKQEFERPINFRTCSLPRRSLKIPCEIEVGENYMELKKAGVKLEKYEKVELQVERRPLTAQERIEIIDIPPDTDLDNVIYENWERKQQ